MPLFDLLKDNTMFNDLSRMASGGSPISSPTELLQALITGVDFADYFCRKLDQYEKDRRYDDNQKKMLVHALRMYEKGELNKDALKTIIDLLPDTAKTQAVEIPQDIDLSAILRKLSQ